MRRRRSLRRAGDPRCCRHSMPQRFPAASWPIAVAVATCGGVAAGDDHSGNGGAQLHQRRHCEELATKLRGNFALMRRSNPDCLHGKSLDCFAALAMTGVEAVALPVVRQHGGTFRALIRH
ncbi:hypothetical protein BJA5080_03839 [Bradyrhizobium diazoefficiens SEMIA 5080]|uniref:Uncharacterized protein n=1 Tax=Bradyrhizobium diazoefficiens SEMIA 5080 TaxID=754504 RepID=A0A837CDZ4_9BRAD|nr:hypothetical protein BJA5080_03839 [Bradyrhizobium diazoefficiens SEMIA 5080]